ncbi:MAG: prenyltransferase [Candidatus Omnitrophica bacterium]|nr:prenyltransferase [Candidatus Omnitrophota bacterium]
MVRDVVRALRLPFLSVSILPFIFGSLIKRGNFNFLGFFLGLIAAGAAHLSANLINDYADSKSGADWQDKNFYKFFGGSKLIQEKIFSEKFYLRLAIIFALVACLSVILLSLVLKSPFVIFIYLAIIFLGWSYSQKPLQFSYHRLGEAFIFLLFGPALVMGGYFIQTRIFPDSMSFLLSLPFGFLTTAILFANEVPDFVDDRKAGKFTWVSIVGPKQAFLLYYLLMLLAFSSVLLNVVLGYLKPWALLAFIFILPAIKAGIILKNHSDDKMHLVDSSRLTIAIQTFVGLVLIAAVIL